MDASLEIRLLERSEFDSVLPLVQLLHPEVSATTLAARLAEMKGQNFRCVGVFEKGKLIAMAGLWLNTRFYCGRTLEPDNVVIHPDERSRGIGEQLMNWIYDYAREIGCETVELNAYVSNDRAHKFWFTAWIQDPGFSFSEDS